MFMDVFDRLPIAAHVDKKYLCVHGGISPDLKSLKDINSFNRVQEVPYDGLFCDLLWSDPMDEEQGKYH